MSSFIEALKTEAKHIEEAVAAAIAREADVIDPVDKVQAAQVREELETRKSDIATELSKAGATFETAVVADVKTEAAAAEKTVVADVETAATK